MTECRHYHRLVEPLAFHISRLKRGFYLGKIAFNYLIHGKVYGVNWHAYEKGIIWLATSLIMLFHETKPMGVASQVKTTSFS